MSNSLRQTTIGIVDSVYWVFGARIHLGTPGPTVTIRLRPLERP